MSPSSLARAAFVFPGQGSQIVGMGKDLYEKSPAARLVFEEIDDTLGRKLSGMIFDGPCDELTRTENAQPAITAVSLAAWKAMGEAVGAPQVPGFVAGHSLGEYSALAVAGVLSIADSARLVVERGRVMQRACDERPGGMAALIGIDEAAAEDVCRQTGAYISNINSGEQIIISGDHMSLARAMDLAAARGARKAIPLSVGGAFHSGLMEPAQHGLNVVMESIRFNDPIAKIVGNVDAMPLTTAAEVKEELRLQLMSCVQWKRSVDTMVRGGVQRFVEVGPGRVLSGLIKRIERNAEVACVSDYGAVLEYAAA
ncbi:MAG: [acyl-carrier-protein] S-malonyltransferase [Dehalococcoidia bacterium]|nr:[acyl-carrier-protein] S-malonyltransferase [Dehalococcoidia bacterium]